MNSPTLQPPRVLVVAYDFPPHAAIGTMRTLRVVRQLAAMGWQVTVLTSDPASFLPTTPVDQALVGTVPSGVTVLRAGSLRLWDGAFNALKRTARGGAGPHGSKPAPAGAATAGQSTSRRRTGVVGALAQAKDVFDAALSIPDREVGWLLPALSQGVRQHLGAATPDIIYSSAPPWTGQLVAYGLRNILRRPWVADFRDPWSRAPWRGDRYRFAMRTAAHLERWVVRRADRIVFVADGNRTDFANHYGPDAARKFSFVPNGCDPSEFDALERPAAVTTRPHVMLHAGSLYAGRTPVPVLQAVARAIQNGHLDRAHFKLRFLGTNAVSSDLRDACRRLGIEDVVEFLPRVPRREGLNAMVSASSLLLLQPGHTVSVPGKVYEYLAAARPIFALAEEGDTADIVRQSGLGVSVTTSDESAILQGLLSVVRMAGQPVSPPPRALYDGYVGAAEIESLLRNTLLQAPSTSSSRYQTP